MVDQIWVYGNSFESTLVAIIVPEKKTLMAWAKEAGVSGDFDVIAKDPKVDFISDPKRSCFECSAQQACSSPMHAAACACRVMLTRLAFYVHGEWHAHVTCLHN